MDPRGRLQNETTVAAIVPVAGRARLLAEALQSVIDQSRAVDEIIVVSNGSAQERKEDLAAAREVLQQGRWQGQLSLLTEEKSGPAAARNRGAAASRAQWLAFLDSDDLWAESKIEAQLAFLSRRPHLRACHCAERWIKQGRELRQPLRLAPRSGFFLAEALETCLISCSSIIIERALFEELGGFDERFPLCEDFELWLRLLRAAPVALLEEKLTTKRSGDWPQLSAQAGLDLWRARALLVFAQSGGLPAELQGPAARSFWRKLQIYRQGARRRHDNDSAELIELEAAGRLHFGSPDEIESQPSPSGR